MSEYTAGTGNDPGEDDQHSAHQDDAAEAGAESPEEGAAAMDDAEDAVSGHGAGSA